MYVDGKYIKVSHPLYKAGKYKSFEHAAFESLGNYKGVVEGQVYILYSPAYPSWCKIGMAVDARDRLSSFQTGTPYRDYILVAYLIDGRLRKKHINCYGKLMLVRTNGL